MSTSKPTETRTTAPTHEALRIVCPVCGAGVQAEACRGLYGVVIRNLHTLRGQAAAKKFRR